MKEAIDTRVRQTIDMHTYGEGICVSYFLICQSTCSLGKRNAYRSINLQPCSLISASRIDFKVAVYKYSGLHMGQICKPNHKIASIR